jgi:hypothetical protein
LTAERVIQPVHRVASHAFHEAQVGIHRLRNGGLAEQKLYELRALVLVEEFGRERVPKVVESEIFVSESDFSVIA